MSHLWVRDSRGDYATVPLSDDPLDMSQSPPAPLLRPTDTPDAVLVPTAREPGVLKWVLLWRPGQEVAINGLPLDTGVRLLHDRDEICVGRSAPVFFSAEALAHVEPFAGSDREMFCPRDKIEVEKGAPSVRCPRCGVVYHQSEERPCWTYHTECAICGRSTELEAGYEWAPTDV